MLSGKEVTALIPHAGSMCLIETVLRVDEGKIMCRSRSHMAPDNPLRSANGLSALCGIEYGVQAMALHSALSGHPVQTGDTRAVIASVRDVEMHVPRMNSILAPIQITATLMARNQSAAKYRFSVDEGEKVLVRGMVTVVLHKLTDE